MSLLFLTLFIIGAWPTSAQRFTATNAEQSDLALFRSVVVRVYHGEAYYPAMNAELRQRNGPTASVFNWRPPTLYVLIARAPKLMVGLLMALMLAVLAGTVLLFRTARPEVTLLAIWLQVGAITIGLTRDGVYLVEVWAGALLALSVLAYLHKRIWLGVLFGLAAVFARELAGPYAIVCLGLALWERRKGEAVVWTVGLLAWVAFYGWHIAQVLPFIQAGDKAHPSWIAFGGWPFIVSTVTGSGWYLMLPRWVSALAATAAVACLWAPVDRHLKAVVVAYVALFAVVGHGFNHYWGIMTGPSWVIATVYGVCYITGVLTAGHGPLTERLGKAMMNEAGTAKSDIAKGSGLL